MIITGDCLDEMKKMASNTISSIVTDPPYGFKFLGKEWDHGIPGLPIWQEALRICKPGSFLLAFGGTRTFHHLTCAIEDAGWQIRDCLMWLYGSGFPKSYNHFGLEGYGTALKPAWEPIIMAMKPCDGTFKQNAEKWGQGGINIDDSRISTKDDISVMWSKTAIWKKGITKQVMSNGQEKGGRWPPNLILDEEASEILDEQSGFSVSRKNKISDDRYFPGVYGNKSLCGDHKPENSHNDSGGASRFFYCAKASPRERGAANHHPTIKPLKLMEYLIKLVMPPKYGILLDPFAGSGTTLLAAKNLGIESIGIEKESEYSEIAAKRSA